MTASLPSTAEVRAPEGVDVCVIVCLCKSAREQPHAPADMHVCMEGVPYTAVLM